MAQTLYDKLWDSHVVHVEDDGTALLYIDRHLVHEVTSPQAYEGLKVAGRKPWRVDSVVATADHNTPTDHWDEGMAGVRDPFAKLQIETLDANMREYGAKVYFPFLDKRQGIVHVIGPEQGATLPGMTVVCGDSHTSTHGAFGCLAHGIGTSEVEHVLATQCLVTKKMKNMRVSVDGPLAPGVSAKDVVLAIIGLSAPHLTFANLEAPHASLSRNWVAFVDIILALSGVEKALCGRDGRVGLCRRLGGEGRGGAHQSENGEATTHDWAHRRPSPNSLGG